MELVEAEALKTYALKIDAATGEVIGEYGQDGERPDLEIDKIVKRHMARHAVTYAEAFKAVCADPANDDAVKAYAQS